VPMDTRVQRRHIGATVLAAGMLLGASFWYASLWVDDPPDETCGSVWRADIWPSRSGCAWPMAGRAALSILLAVAAVLAVGTAVASRRRRGASSASAQSVGRVIAAAVLVLLVVNELTRPDGLSGH
jgi:hypothetical protein